jgi:hypothetical protein
MIQNDDGSKSVGSRLILVPAVPLGSAVEQHFILLSCSYPHRRGAVHLALAGGKDQSRGRSL